MTLEADASWTAHGAAAVVDPTGLHARPAVKVARLAKSFDAAVEMARDSQAQWINAKSLSAIIRLRAPHGERLMVRAAGADAERAVSEIVALIERNFES